MSWDIVLFKSKEKIIQVSNLDEKRLVPVDFCERIENHFKEIIKDNDHRTVKGKDFEIDYFLDEELVSSKIVSIHGEEGLFQLIELAKKENWQIYDCGLDDMIDLENPKNNGYEDFQKYVKKILRG